MDLTPTDEQEALREAARGFLQRAAPADALAATLDGRPHWDPDVWPRLAALGWLGISAPESHGGADLGLVEEAIVLEEVGAALLPAPVHSAIGLALPVLLAAGDAERLADLVEGAAVVTLAWAERDGRAALAHANESTVRATRAPGGWRLAGSKRWVPDAARADVILVPAQTDEGVAIFGVRQGAGVLVVADDTIDPIRPLADVELGGAEAQLLVGAGDGAAVLETVRRRALVLACAEAVGIAQRMLDLTAAYASSREQFGRVIGTYQAVSHQVADLYVDLELSRSIVLWAALLVDEADDDAPAAVAAAAAKALPAAVAACETAIQVHGGVGTTWESPLHRYLKHALALSAIDLTPAGHRAEVLHYVREASNDVLSKAM